MKKIILLFSVILFTSTLSFSQDTTSYKAAIQKLMDVSGTRATYKAAMSQMIKMFKERKSNVPEAVWDELEVAFDKAASEDLLNMLYPIYQKHLTEDEIKGVIAFYESPAGKKFAEKTPLITQESMQVGQQWGKKIGMELAKKIIERGY